MGGGGGGVCVEVCVCGYMVCVVGACMHMHMCKGVTRLDNTFCYLTQA